ncbi:hypothetical protein BY458DRAFT_279194 [Sporodiniella umbellata]|nr:hypothetical protein BY458DRAFT_279194 [Sporodiniella umbellata]
MEPETQDALFCRSQRTRDDFTVLSTKGYFIKTIEHDLWECVSSITSMDLCCNEIEEIPYSLPIATPHLKYLDISSNKITRLPESIGQWKMMICFILETGSGKNMIKNLPDSMKNMKDLKGFKATSCGIEYIPPGLFATSIETINLCNNRLTHFRPSLFAGKLTSLKFLDLSRNANLELSEDLPAYIPNVELVMVGNNKASKFPLCKKRKTFDVSLVQTENSIKSLPASMKNMTKLEKFDASNSSITHLEPNAFSPSLIDIDLSSNRLECIKESAFSCSAERIDLRLNQISFIEACSFGSSIKHINLRSNRLSRNSRRNAYVSAKAQILILCI